MKHLFRIGFLVLITLAFFSDTFTQSRTNRLWRPCANTTQQAKVEIEPDGDINIVPCPLGTFLLNGSPTTPTGLATLNGLIGSSQTFGTPTAADTAGWSSAGTVHTLQLPIRSVSGLSRTAYVPIFDSENTMAKSAFSRQTPFYYRLFETVDPFNFHFDGQWGEYSISQLFGSNQFFYNASNRTFNVIFDDEPEIYLGNPAGTYFQVSGGGGILAQALTNYQFVNLGDSGIDFREEIPGNNGTRFLIQDSAMNTGANFYFSSFHPEAAVHFNGLKRFGIWHDRASAGATGDRTTDKAAGTVRLGGGASTVTVTNSNAFATSSVFTQVKTNDATCTVKNVVTANGSFTVNMTAACTAETEVAFFIIYPL